MHALRTLLPLVIALGVVSCRSATEPLRHPLVGAWAAPVEAHLPKGTITRDLLFSPNGRFTNVVTLYGIYENQRAGEISAYFRTTGTVALDGDRLDFRADSLVVWDRFYGVSSPPTVRTPSPHGEIYDDARFVLAGNVLTLHFTVYPADAPVPAQQRFTRTGQPD